jgi:TIR domain
MSENDDEVFWEDLFSHIRQRQLVPVVGPDLSVVNVDGAEQTFTSLISHRLVQRYDLSASPEPTTIGKAVTECLRQHGQDEVDGLYRVINNIIAELDPAPGDALRNLASVDDLRLFVSTTPDRLLAKAVNEVRFEGRPATRELTFCPSLSTIEQSRNARPARTTDTVVLNLFGQATPTAQYAIHDEDQLEWLHALLSEWTSLPEWLVGPLKHHPMLFVGCEIPDWLGRFLLRMSSTNRLSMERDQQFFIVGNPISRDRSLSDFFKIYCRKTLVRQLDMEPAKFAAQLHERWKEQAVDMPRAPLGLAGASAGFGIGDPPDEDAPTIFISYMREDADAARRLADAITSQGGDVWFDERRILPGDEWEPEVLSRIRRTVRLFVPVISANTEGEDEGYVFREWRAAVERSQSIMGRRFIVPVIIDDDYTGDAGRYQQIPDEFRPLHFGRAPGGEPDAGLIEMLNSEIRDMRRVNAA